MTWARRLGMAVVCGSLLVCADVALCQQTKTLSDPSTPVLRLASVHWPPYTGPDLPHGGALTEVVRAALSREGVRLEVVYYPWNRVIHAAGSEEGIDGYFPEYYSDRLAHDYYFSSPIGTGRLGFAQRDDVPVEWRYPPDLAPFRIGVVFGYVNTWWFDQAVHNESLHVEGVREDVLNLRKLAAGRIDLAVIDEHVLRWLKITDPALSGAKISFNPQILEDKLMFVCLRQSERGRLFRDTLDRGLTKINAAEILDSFLSSGGPRAGR